MSGHTPGPWRLTVGKCFYINGTDANGDRAFILQRDICTYAKKEKQDRIRADVQLIAAAPDLLEALQRLIPHAHFMTMCATAEDHIVVAAVDRARDAIAKATGATP